MVGRDSLLGNSNIGIQIEPRLMEFLGIPIFIFVLVIVLGAQDFSPC